MNARQEAKLNMYRSVLSQADENAALLQTVPAYAAAIAALKTNVAAILNTVQQQIQVTTGATIHKTASKQALCSFTNDIAAALFAYAAATEELVLKEKAKINLSDLLRTKDEELAPRCRNYYELAKNNADGLKDYGITEALISAYKTAIDSYATVVPVPRNLVAQRAAYRTNLAELIKTADKILKERVDKLVNNLKAINPGYVNAYQSNRAILGPATTVTQLKIAVTAAGNSPVKNAELYIEQQNITLKANTKEGFRIKPVTPGVYTLQISAPGFETQTIGEVKILQGQITSLPVTLVPKG